MSRRSSVICIVLGLAVIGIIGLTGTGCKQDPDNITVTNAYDPNPFRGLYIKLTADSLLIPGVEIPLRAIAEYGSYAEQDWTNRVTWSVPDSGFGTISADGVFRAKRSGSGDIAVVSPEGWLGQRSLDISDVHEVRFDVDQTVMFRDDTTHVSLLVMLQDGQWQTVPARVTVAWQFSDASVLSFCDSRHMRGMHTGLTTLKATLSGMASEPRVLTVDSVLSVTCTELSSGPYFPMDTVVYHAAASTAVSGRIDVTDRARWVTSSPGSFADVGNGKFVAVAPGSYSVYADLGGQSSSAVQASVWNVTALTISPAAVSDTLFRGDTLVFSAVGTVEGLDSAQSLTRYAEWISTDAGAGTFVAPGVFVAGGAGMTTVWARVGTVTSSEVNFVVARTPLFTETFEAYSLGGFSGGTLWNVNYYSPSRCAISSTASGGAKSCMIVDSSYSSYAYMNTRTGAFAPLTQGTVEADLRTEGDGLYFGTQSASGYAITQVVFEFGTMYAYTYSGNIALQNYVSDRWYHVRMDFNCDTDTYDVYVDGVLRGSDLSFYYSTSTVYYVSAGTSSNYQGNRSYVDNIFVSE